MGRSLVVHKDAGGQNFTLTPALSLKGEGELKDPDLNGVELDFSRPAKPTNNAFIESFNGRFRQECPDENWFLSLEDARGKVESWRDHYNGEQPHNALENLSPREFAVLSEIAD